MDYDCECMECGRPTFKYDSYMRPDGGYVCRFCEGDIGEDWDEYEYDDDIED